METLRPSSAARRLLVFGVGVAAFALSYLASLVPGVVEAVYAGGWARLVAPTLSRATGAVPFSLVEPLVGGYLAWRLVTAVRGVREVRRGVHPARSAAGAGALLLLRDLGAGLVLFYVLWGFHYARTPVADRIGLPELDAVSTRELVVLSEELVEMANEAYRELHGTDDAGAPTAWPADWGALRGALRRGWERTGRELRLGPLATARFGAPKPLTLSPLLARLGVSGFYFPFTAEALVNDVAPPVFAAASLSHEQAHQRGITSEGEASFLGFVVAAASEDPLLRYAAAARTQGRFLALLARRDTAEHRRLADARIPGVRRDLIDYAAYSRRYAGAVSEATTRVNDAYLRAHRVPGGVASYGQVSELLLRYARGRGGTLLPTDGDPSDGDPSAGDPSDGDPTDGDPSAGGAGRQEGARRRAPAPPQPPALMATSPHPCRGFPDPFEGTDCTSVRGDEGRRAFVRVFVAFNRRLDVSRPRHSPRCPPMRRFAAIIAHNRRLVPYTRRRAGTLTR